ncbi:hypothetical protein DAI22_06g257503 [Oryza sativa Japonica Group]|nr:hypothetical protein DAI22_06g257503 [Oryza sativa Japonica Group]
MTMISQELAASLPAPSGGEVKTHGATPTCVPACLPPSVWRLPNSTRRRRCQIVKFYWRVSSPTQPHSYSVCVLPGLSSKLGRELPKMWPEASKAARRSAREKGSKATVFDLQVCCLRLSQVSPRTPSS